MRILLQHFYPVVFFCYSAVILLFYSAPPVARPLPLSWLIIYHCLLARSLRKLSHMSILQMYTNTSRHKSDAFCNTTANFVARMDFAKSARTTCDNEEIPPVNSLSPLE